MQLKVQEGVDEMRAEIVTLRQELLKINREMTPLTAITDLCIKMKRMVNKENPDAPENFYYTNMTEDQKVAELSHLNKEAVLNTLAEFVNT